MNADVFQFHDVDTDVNGHSLSTDITIYDTALGGGLNLYDGIGFLLWQEGPQLFTGPPSSPTFLLNSFTLTSESAGETFNQNFP